MYNVDIGCKYDIIMKDSTIVTVKEAAKILGVHPTTLRRWDKSGKLRAIRHRFNNYRLYKKSEIKKIITEIQK